MGKRNERSCTVCDEIITFEEYVKGGMKCNSCCSWTICKRELPSEAPDDLKDADDTKNADEPQNKRLRKRVKELEQTVVELSNRLHDQEKKTIAIEKMIEGFILGVRVRDSKNKEVSR